jgi:aminopeptidase N
MRTENAPLIRLVDYTPPAFLIPTIALDIHLAREQAEIAAHLSVMPNPAAPPESVLRLDLDGNPPRRVLLDGRPLQSGEYEVTDRHLIIPNVPPRPFTLETMTLINPSANTALSGLYRSGQAYCTQCEAEGFRRITAFLDRPDVMSRYSVRIEADRSDAPILLANGNRISAGDLPGGRHFAVWQDPWPKPAYLFALVAGDLAVVRDRFETMSGRDVALEIYVEHGKEDRCAWAMQSLKTCMRWDETAFGREYDLDVFMIVAVSDFNMGAMENKGLNIFNDKYVLALPDVATDADYVAIEAIVAHEYFHNWTGNRITCRDWFQLCLKEGLTVFRDQEFTSDLRSRAVKRITDVRNLRAAQFAEDGGPLAHPVRPEAYSEINNFYTPTIYEKGAELVRLLKVIIGAEAFARGMALYFERCDGTAATIEDFLGCFANASGRDLSGMLDWYAQAGTPEVTVTVAYDAAAKTARLDLSQVTRPTPRQVDKVALPIPLVTALLGPDGTELPLVTAEGPLRDGLILLETPSRSITFVDVPARPVPSVGRGFSAPVKLNVAIGDEELLLLFARDSDSFVKWQAGQTLMMRRLVAEVAGSREGPDTDAIANALRAVLEDKRLEPAYQALAITLPSEGDLSREIGSNIDPDAIHAARIRLKASLAGHLGSMVAEVHAAQSTSLPYTPDAASVGRRALSNTLLDYLSALGDTAPALRQATGADNMTDRFAALSVLCQRASAEVDLALQAFHDRHADDALVLDKWFGLNAAIPDGSTLPRVRRLMGHPAFSLANPNRARALIGAFAMSNPTQFARVDGAGFALLAEVALEVDPKNPQLAARLLGSFRSWRTYEPVRRAAARACLEQIAAKPGLSIDSLDIVRRALD